MSGPLMAAEAPAWARRYAQQVALTLAALGARPVQLPVYEDAASAPAPDGCEGCAIYLRDPGRIAVSTGAAWETM